jgi:hypothetical protein
MATRRTTPAVSRQMLPAHSDAIRIVPLHPGAGAGAGAEAPAIAPRLTYRNGPLIASAEVFTVFWGTAWNAAPQKAMMQEMNQFFDFILKSPLIDQLAEYNAAHYKIVHGRRTGTTVLTAPVLQHSVNDGTIQHTLQHEIASNSAFPQPSPNTLYFLFFPPGVKVVQGGAASCTAFCGYHNDILGQIFYAAMPFPGCAGCTGGLQPIDALTSTSSHELCEAITDAIPGQGWYDDTNGEIGDICAWKTKKIGKYTVQLEWSNKAGKCV